jgi:hypothetical protein
MFLVFMLVKEEVRDGLMGNLTSERGKPDWFLYAKSYLLSPGATHGQVS